MKRWVWWLVFALVVGGLLSLVSSNYPDGFETAGEQLGYMERARELFHAPFAEYQIPGLPEGASTAAAGVLGVLLAFGLFVGVGRILTPRSGSDAGERFASGGRSSEEP
ncbi:MAG: PDGLE domain-containing protein [Brockia lithotrophica]|nr:PDGLE domain-containing protein [Brockia lithotrophica]